MTSKLDVGSPLSDASTAASPTKKTDISPLAEYLYSELVKAEDSGSLFVLNDLLECARKELSKNEFETVLKERYHSIGGTHPWIREGKRAEECLRVDGLATHVELDDGWKKISGAVSDDLEINVYYAPTKVTGEMSFICKALVRNLPILPLSVLIAEVDRYGDWMPVVGECATIDRYDRGYTCKIQFESPMPKIVNSRDITMHLKVDQDFYRPSVPKQWKSIVKKYLSPKRNGFQMYTESLPNDPALKAIGPYKSFLPTITEASAIQELPSCLRSHLRHGAAFIETRVDSQGRPEVQVNLIATVNVFMPRPPSWVLKFIGGKIFEQIVTVLVGYARQVDEARSGKPVEWEFAKTFADSIDSGILYEWMKKVTPDKFATHR